MTPAPSRRWFHYSLRTLFVVVTGLSCWIAWIAWTFRTTTWDVDRIPVIVASIFIAMILGGAFLTWIVAPERDEK